MSEKKQNAEDSNNKTDKEKAEEKSPVNIEDSYDEKTTVLPEHFNDPQYKPLTDELKDAKIKMQKISQLLTMDTYMSIDGKDNGKNNEFNIVFPDTDKNNQPINLTDPDKKEIVLDKLQEYSDTFFNGVKDHDYNLWLREKNLEYFDDDGKIPPILIFKKSKGSVSSGPLGRNYHDSNDINMDPQIKKTKEIKGLPILKNEFSNRGMDLGFYGAIPALAAAFAPLIGPVGATALTVASSTVASNLKDKKDDILDLQKDVDFVFELVDPFMKDFKLHHEDDTDGGRLELLDSIYKTKDTHELSKEIFEYAPFIREELTSYEDYKTIKEKLQKTKKEYKEAEKNANLTPEKTSLKETYEELKNKYKEEKKKAPVEVISKSPDISIQYLNFSVKNFCSQIEVKPDGTLLEIKNFYDEDINIDNFKNHIKIIHNCIYSYFESKDDSFISGYKNFTNVIVQILYLMMKGTDEEKIQKTYFFSVLCIKKINTMLSIKDIDNNSSETKEEKQKKKTLIKLLFSKNKIEFPEFDKVYKDVVALEAGASAPTLEDEASAATKASGVGDDSSLVYSTWLEQYNFFTWLGNEFYSIQFFINFIDCVLFTSEFSTKDNIQKVCQKLVYDICFLHYLYYTTKDLSVDRPIEAYDDITSLTIQYIILQFFELKFPLFEDWELEKNYTLLLGNKNDIEKDKEDQKAAISKLLEEKIPELIDGNYKILLGPNVNDEIKKKLEPEIGITVNFRIPKESDSSFFHHLNNEKDKILSKAENVGVAIDRIDYYDLSSGNKFEFYEGVIANIDKNKNIITIVFTIEEDKYFELYTPKEFLEERIVEIVDLEEEKEERINKIEKFEKASKNIGKEMAKMFPSATGSTDTMVDEPPGEAKDDEPRTKPPNDANKLPGLGITGQSDALKRMQERMKQRSQPESKSTEDMMKMLIRLKLYRQKMARRQAAKKKALVRVGPEGSAASLAEVNARIAKTGVGPPPPPPLIVPPPPPARGGYKNFPSILTLRRAANKKSKSINIKYIKRRRKKTDPNLTKRRRVKIHRSKSQKVKRN